jgi:hypothetical protein
VFRPERRGVYPHVVPVLATGFPFGIWNCHRSVPVAGELIVWPQTVPLRSVPAMRGDRLTVAGSYVDRAGDDGDILAARLYRHGDSLRRVHWAQTARRDVLVVCERQSTARRRVVVALDGASFAGSEQHTRVRWLDAMAYAIWLLTGRGRSERRLRATVRLLEWRCRRSGWPRPAGTTLSHWYGGIAASLSPEAASAMTGFLGHAERVLYRPCGDHGAAGSLDQTCHSVVRHMNMRMLRKLKEHSHSNARCRPAAASLDIRNNTPCPF